MPRTRFLLVLASLIAGAALATLESPDPVVSLESLAELWSDTVRDTDQIGMKLTRVSDAAEMRIGAQLARGLADLAPEKQGAQDYVNAVGQTVAQHVSRRGIHYEFHIFISGDINGFSLPGGQVFVTDGMLHFIQSEAELAVILGHEISHIDLRHCIERYQYEAKLTKAGIPEAGQMAEIAHHVAMSSFSQYQESDADAQGQRMNIESGYDPGAAVALCTRMRESLGESSSTRAITPAGEIAQSIGGALDSFFRSHPPSEKRACNLDAIITRRLPALKGKPFYAGRRNLAEQVPRSVREYPEEYRILQ